MPGTQTAGQQSVQVLESFLVAGDVPSAGSADSGNKADAIAHALAALGLLQGWQVKQLGGQHLVKEARVYFRKDHWQFCRPPLNRLLPIAAPVSYVRSTRANDGSARGAVDVAFKQLRPQGEGGATVVDDEAAPLLFSCKWGECLGLGKLDIEKMLVQGQDVFGSVRIGLIIPTFEMLQQSARNSHQTAVLDSIQYVCDAEDLRAGIAAYARQPEAYWIQLDNAALNGLPKAPLHLRLHQQLECTHLAAQIQQGQRQLILGWMARMGKTYGAVAIASMVALANPQQEFRILVVCTRPGDTKMQWTNVIDNTWHPSNITQFLLRSKNSFDQGRQDDLGKFDIIFIDEAHWGGQTDLMRQHLQTLQKPATAVVHVTATWRGMQAENRVPVPDCCISQWTMVHTRLACKSQWQTLAKDFGDAELKEALRICYALDVQDLQFAGVLEAVQRDYADLPIMKVRQLKLDPATVPLGCQSDAGLSWAALLKVDRAGLGSQHTSSAHKQFLPSHKPYIQKVVLSHILGVTPRFRRDDTTRHGHTRSQNDIIRAEIQQASPLSGAANFLVYLFFLPYGAAAEIVHTADAMLNFLTTDDGSRFDFPYIVINCARFTPVEDSDRRHTIKQKIAQARRQQKTGVVILTGDKLSMGITLEEVDVVVHMNEFKSANQWLQRSARSMTERKTPAKPFGWVNDASISRTICMSGSLVVSSHTGRPIQKKEAMQELLTNVIHIDIDSFAADGTVQTSSLDPDAAVDIWHKAIAADRSRSRIATDTLAKLRALRIAAAAGDKALFALAKQKQGARTPDMLRLRMGNPTGHLSGITGVAAGVMNESEDEDALDKDALDEDTNADSVAAQDGDTSTRDDLLAKKLLEPLTVLLSILTLDSDACQPSEMLQLLVSSKPALVEALDTELQWAAPTPEQPAWEAVQQILQRPEVRMSPAAAIANNIKAAIREQQGTSSSYVDTVEVVNNYLLHNGGLPQAMRELSSARAARYLVERAASSVWDAGKLLDVTAGTGLYAAAMADHLLSLASTDNMSAELAANTKATVWQRIYAQEQSVVMAALMSAALPDLATDHIYTGNILKWDGANNQFMLIAGLPPNDSGEKSPIAPHLIVEQVMDLLQDQGHVMVYANNRWMLQ